MPRNSYSPAEVSRIWLWVYYYKIPIYPIFYLLKGDYNPLHLNHKKLADFLGQFWESLELNPTSLGFRDTSKVYLLPCPKCCVVIVYHPISHRSRSSHHLTASISTHDKNRSPAYLLQASLIESNPCVVLEDGPIIT